MTRKLAVLCGLLAMTLEPALADTPPAANKIKRIYDVSRNGSKIGTDTVEIDKQGNTTTVKFTTHISVVVAFIEVYKLEHTATETWNGNQFVSFKSQTNDNGTKHTIAVTTATDKLRMDVDGKPNDAPRAVVPGSFWSKALIPSGEIFDEDDGKRASVKLADIGEEQVTANGVKYQAHHYRVSGGMERDLWFDGDVLVRLALKGTDGSKIVSDLRP
jgi:Family of unknown function (DUF6134)